MKRFIFFCFFTLVFFLCDTPNVQAQDIAVKSHDMTLNMPGRARALEIKILYPDEDGTYPVLIWSPNVYGDMNSYEPLTRFWAENGYVVITPAHLDSQRYNKNINDSVLFNRAAEKWDTRPQDIIFILDYLEGIIKRLPDFKGSVDTGRIGVGGHSFGALTAQLLAGATVPKENGDRHRFEDRRIKAFIAISPFGYSNFFDKDSFKRLRAPMFFLTATNDINPYGRQIYSWRLDAYKDAPAGDKFLMVVEGAHHYLGGISGDSAFEASVRNLQTVNDTRKTLLYFWNAYLKDFEAEKHKLFQKDLPIMPTTKVSFEHK